MLLTINDLEQNSLLESVLENSVFLNDNIHCFSAKSIPVIELDENVYIIDSMYVDRLASDECITLSEALENISLINTIPSEDLYIAFQEHEMIINPQLATLVENYVIIPISESSPIYTFCETCIEAFVESGDEMWLELLLEEDALDYIHNIMNDKTMTQAEKMNAVASIRRKNKWELEAHRRLQQAYPNENRFNANNGFENKRFNTKDTLLRKGKRIAGEIGDTIKNNKGKIALGAVATGAAAFGAKTYIDNKREEERQMEELRRIEAEMARQPKSVIGKKIASLRRIYSNYLERARAAKDAGQAGIFKKIASAILGVIDKLMARLQKFAG